MLQFACRLTMRTKSLIALMQKFRSAPLTRKTPLRGFARFVRWQMVSRLAQGPLVMSYVNTTRLLVSRGMTGATGNIYFGLMEFEDMGFMLHFLRASDRFADIGANVGAYTVLAAGVTGAETLAIEPVASTRMHLMDNLRINNIEQRVRVEGCAVGAKNAEITFTIDSDTTNHVLAEGETYQGKSISVSMRRIDDLLADFVPSLVKIDVEGYEYAALKHAAQTLDHPECLALIVEINGSGKRYDIPDETVDAFIRSFGFQPFAYDPFTKNLRPLANFGTHNTIYVKNIEEVQDRVRRAKAFTVLGIEI